MHFETHAYQRALPENPDFGRLQQRRADSSQNLARSRFQKLSRQPNIVGIAFQRSCRQLNRNLMGSQLERILHRPHIAA